MAAHEFEQIGWDSRTANDCRELIRLAIREDLDAAGDLTSKALVPEDAEGQAAFVARQAGTVAGLRAVQLALEELHPQLAWQPLAADGDRVAPGTNVGIARGPVRGLLAAERLALNLLCRLSGIASLTAQYVAAIAGAGARIYDTRKTTPGWRRIEKYAVRCGGGWNHREGLFAAILIKDNHLAFGARTAALDARKPPAARFSPAEAILRARQWASVSLAASSPVIIEIEVDDLDQLAAVLPAGPEIVLLDNFSHEMLRAAVGLRNEIAPGVELEASGGITLDTIRAVAQTGVDRISAGALTHSAKALDFGLDWLPN